MEIKKKIGVFAVVFVVVAAMTGIAAADHSVNMDVVTIYYPHDGTPSSPYEVTVTTSVGGIHKLAVSGNGNIMVQITGNNVDTGWVENSEDNGWDAVGGDTYTFYLCVKGTGKDASVTSVTITDSEPAAQRTYDVKSDTVNCEEEIIHAPEFTTIALPVASVIGLFLFFNYRKREKA